MPHFNNDGLRIRGFAPGPRMRKRHESELNPQDKVVTSNTPITVLIAVAVRLYREGLAESLGAHACLQVHGAVGCLVDAQAAVRNRRPDVVIVDIGLEDSLSLMRTLRAECSETRILAFAVREDIASILSCAEAGADGFVTANGSLGELVEAVVKTAAGELLCSPRIAAQLLRRAAHREKARGDAVSQFLTLREQQVFSLLRQGRSNKEIAAALSIAEATVKNHVHHVLEKLHVETRGKAMAFTTPPSP